MRARFFMLPFLLITWVILFGCRTYLPRLLFFQCHAVRHNQLYTLDRRAHVREIESRDRFIEWVKGRYFIEPQEINSYLVWEQGGVQYQAHFNDVNLESVIIKPVPYEAKVSDIISCFGEPSETFTESVSTEQGLTNHTQLWYDRYRLSITATSPTTEPTSTLLEVDEKAKVTSISWFTIPSYELEKP